MVIVVFELKMNPGVESRYFDLAGLLREEVESHPGFLGIERFESLSEAGKFVSISAWEDECAVTAWRQNMKHRLAQDEGRAEIFADYRLRVAEVIRDYSLETSPFRQKLSAGE